MALDNNHVTKLGELKQLIDGLWSKVTTAISNAVSGLLSKSEADATYQVRGSYATQSELNSLGNSLSGSIGSINAKIPNTASETNKLATAEDIPDVSGFETSQHAESTYAKKGDVPSTDNFAKKDGSNATGTWGIDISGNAATAGSVSPQSDYYGYLELKPTATTLDVFRGNCDVDGSLLNAIKSIVNSPILENSDNRSATFFGRLDLSANATLKSLLGTGTYPFYFVSISRQSGFVLISSITTFNNIFGSIIGQKPSIGYLRNLVCTTVNTAIGSASNPVYVAANGVVTPCGNVATATNASRLVTKSLNCGSDNVYGVYLGDLSSTTASSFSVATFLLEVSLASSYKSMQYMVRLEKRASGQFRAILNELGTHTNDGFPYTLNVVLAYYNVSDYSSSGNGVSRWYILFKDLSGANTTRQYVRFSICNLFENQGKFDLKLTSLTGSAPTITGYSSARMHPSFVTTDEGIGGASNPVYVNTAGSVVACNFKVV